MELNLKEIPCIIADDLTDEQIKAFRLADNKVSEKSEWNIDLLGDELDEILNIDMTEFGFDGTLLDSDDYGTDFELPSGDKKSLTDISFSLTQEQADFINEALKDMKGTKEYKDFHYEENQNSNGNAIYLIVDQWEKLRK